MLSRKSLVITFAVVTMFAVLVPGRAQTPLVPLVPPPVTFVHHVFPVPTANCGDTELAHAVEFAQSREKLAEEDVVSKRELIYAYMLWVEVLRCRGSYSEEKYCSSQADYLAQLGKMYALSGLPGVPSVPLPGHHIASLVALRSRCGASVQSP